MTAPHRRSRLLALTMPCAAAVALIVVLAAAPPARSASYKKCSLGQRDQQPGGTTPKPTYNFKLRQQRTSCSTARRVMRGYHGCRSLTSYRCTKKVLRHWSCSARKTSSTKLMFSASYTCKWGKRRVTGTYQQDIPSP